MFYKFKGLMLSLQIQCVLKFYENFMKISMIFVNMLSPLNKLYASKFINFITLLY